MVLYLGTVVLYWNTVFTQLLDSDRVGAGRGHAISRHAVSHWKCVGGVSAFSAMIGAVVVAEMDFLFFGS